MKTTLAQDRAVLAEAGIIIDGEFRHYAGDAAQPGLLTEMNGGIPAFLSNYLDPKVINTLLTPMKAVEITGERGMGSWAQTTAQFPLAEYTGGVSTYGDQNNNGSNGFNVNWTPRQAYTYQSFCRWGDQELARYGLAKIDFANEVRNARALNFNKFQNKSYFFGIANLQNYGLLNDPSLSAAVTPATKAAGGTTWAVATADEIVKDIRDLYNSLQLQLQGLASIDGEMLLCMSPFVEAQLLKTATGGGFATSVMDVVKKSFPKLRIITANEYKSTAGELLQLIIPTIDGTKTVEAFYTEKLRTFPVLREHSAYSQKFSAGTWGVILKRPLAIKQMLGV